MRKIFLMVILPLLAALGVYIFLSSIFLSPLNKESKERKIVLVKKGMKLTEVCQLLQDFHIIRSAKGLCLIAKIRGVKIPLQQGEYVLSPSMAPLEVLEELEKGKVLKHTVRILPGMTLREISQKVAEAQLVDEKLFYQEAHSPTLLARAGISAQSFEGYLFPALYTFIKPITAKEIIWTMLEKGEKIWKPEYSDRAEELKLSRHEILTIASIIEREAELFEERPVISSVIHNRLSQGMKLQVPSTLAYSLGKEISQLTEEDYKKQDPYNTFVYYGLPPGPICSPSEESVKAALYSKKTPYLFFVKTKDGGHIFATTELEYQQALKKAQQSN